MSLTNKRERMKPKEESTKNSECVDATIHDIAKYYTRQVRKIEFSSELCRFVRARHRQQRRRHDVELRK